MPLISLTRTTIYDTDSDLDLECSRVDQLSEEEVLAYVPENAKYRNHVIKALELLAESIATGPYPLGIAVPDVSKDS